MFVSVSVSVSVANLTYEKSLRIIHSFHHGCGYSSNRNSSLPFSIALPQKFNKLCLKTYLMLTKDYATDVEMDADLDKDHRSQTSGCLALVMHMCVCSSKFFRAFSMKRN